MADPGHAIEGPQRSMGAASARAERCQYDRSRGRRAQGWIVNDSPEDDDHAKVAPPKLHRWLASW